MMNANERMNSLLSDRHAPPISVIPFPQIHLVSLARVRMDAGHARPWRITLSRLDRADSAFIAQGEDTLYPGQQYQYLFATKPFPALPPRRTNPIYGNVDPSNGAFINDQWVEIAWGTQSGSGASRLLAHWPSCGGSIVVSGTYVEVWGGAAINLEGSPPTPPESRPVFQASIDHAEGLAPGDAGAELSLIISKGVLEPAEGGEFQTQADDALPDTGWTVGAIPSASLRGSAVLDVAPFVGWRAGISRFPSPTPFNPIITLFTGLAGPAVTVTDNAAVDALGVVTASPGNVAIVINTTIPVSFLDIETGITGNSSIIAVTTPSPNPAFFVASAPSSWTNVPIVFDPPIAGQLGIAGRPTVVNPASSIPPVLEGAVFYVPDFARRVEVILTQSSISPRVPLNGDPRCQVVFFDDRGLNIYGWRQGLVLAGAAVVGNNSPLWHPVPDNAVLMGVYSDPAVTNNIAKVHWRIAP